MPDEPIPLAKPELGDREEEMVLEALRSGRLSLGPRQEAFESAFAGWLGVRDAVATSSGTTALHLGVRALGWGEGDEVITTPLSFVASANCLLYEHATPVFCDVDPVTLDIDPQAAAAVAGERTAGILPVHIFGYPADLESLTSLAAKHDLGLMEDACQAIGAIDAQGHRVGTRGNLTTFAFYSNKQMTTGEGGMLVTTDEETAQRARSERNQGRAADMDQVDHERIGFNYRLTELQAAVGIAQLEKLDGILRGRDRLSLSYRTRLTELGATPPSEGDDDGLLLPCEDRGKERRSWFVFCVQLPAGTDRATVIEELAKRGIASKAYLPCIHLMPPYRERFSFRAGQFPVAERAAERSLALPFFNSMTEEQIERVCTALGEILGLT